MLPFQQQSDEGSIAKNVFLIALAMSSEGEKNELDPLKRRIHRGFLQAGPLFGYDNHP